MDRAHLYFAESAIDGAIKIGCSANPTHRALAVGREFGDRLSIRAVAEDRGGVESSMHRMFAKDCIRRSALGVNAPGMPFEQQTERRRGPREWFRPSPRLGALMSYIARDMPLSSLGRTPAFRASMFGLVRNHSREWCGAKACDLCSWAISDIQSGRRPPTEAEAAMFEHVTGGELRAREWPSFHVAPTGPWNGYWSERPPCRRLRASTFGSRSVGL